MEMRAVDDVDIGRNLTPALLPLAHALHDSFLASHCSSCFSPLTAPPSPPPAPVSVSCVFYCSQVCYASDSTLHVSSGELQLLLCHSPSEDGDTSDLRAALRLLAALGDSSCGDGCQRIKGLLTNRHKLLAPETANVKLASKIQRGAEAMAAARQSQKTSSNVYGDMKGTMLEEAVICAVLTNAVEVQDSGGRILGIAIYDTDFSWINHSCSPNTCYRFQFCASSNAAVQSLSKSMTWISPFHCGVEMNNSASVQSGLGREYGPRIMLRSIKSIEKGAEVTVAYTDILQPKALRLSELHMKYQFTCNCTRCSVDPPTYVDQILQNFHEATNVFPMETGGVSLNKDDAIEKLTDWMDDIVASYFSDGDAESCCLELEKLLTVRILEEDLKSDIGKIGQRNHCLLLHPLHYLSIEAHTILASAYKVRGNLLCPPPAETDSHTWEASGLNRTSAAYSLLLAGSVHYLFCFEPSLIGSAANFWANAGESLLNLASRIPAYPSTENNKASTCSLANQPASHPSSMHASYADFQSTTDDFLKCMSHFAREIWDLLTHGCPYLQGIRDPINFNWLETTSDLYSRSVRDVSHHELLRSSAEKGMAIFQLGVHCALYGKFLSSICYGGGSH
ncbi:hypothetical protein SAY87_011480 [Trapa incisa]|uniref:SET domain-containing protein n=1 Tax=Trapa incisa TaxID=236973 RepID=A0AAN7GIM3_9MYRT|nr:hypothetical protein SAY87_011480 [Trapa incisa]